MAARLADSAKKLGIRYFLISYVDLFGAMRAKLVPAAAIGEMASTGAAFAGFATWLDMTPADPDTFAVPDPDSLIQLPWKKEVGWLASDLYMGGKLVGHAYGHLCRLGHDPLGLAPALCRLGRMGGGNNLSQSAIPIAARIEGSYRRVR